jgi:hypothetical protein
MHQPTARQRPSIIPPALQATHRGVSLGRSASHHPARPPTVNADTRSVLGVTLAETCEGMSQGRPGSPPLPPKPTLVPGHTTGQLHVRLAAAFAAWDCPARRSGRIRGRGGVWRVGVRRGACGSLAMLGLAGRRSAAAGNTAGRNKGSGSACPLVLSVRVGSWAAPGARPAAGAGGHAREWRRRQSVDPAAVRGARPRPLANDHREVQPAWGGSDTAGPLPTGKNATTGGAQSCAKARHGEACGRADARAGVRGGGGKREGAAPHHGARASLLAPRRAWFWVVRTILKKPQILYEPQRQGRA